MHLTLVAAEAGLTRVATADDITFFDFTDRSNPLADLLGAECFKGTVLMDLEKSPYIDSSGVGWLIQCHNHFQKAGGRLVLHSIPPMVNHCFRVLGMYDMLHIVANEKAALEMAALHA